MVNKRPAIITDLLTQLNNEDWVIRYNAAKILGDIDAEEAIHQLLDKLERENNRDVRRSIVIALGEIDLKVAIPDLIEIMENDSSMIVRYTAARALSRMGALEAIEQIKERVKKEVNSESLFWFHISLLRLEKDPKNQSGKILREMKKKKLLNDKMKIIYAKVLKEIKRKK